MDKLWTVEKQIMLINSMVGHCLYNNYNGFFLAEGWNPVYHDFSAILEYEIVKITTEYQNVDIIEEFL